jgi:hypothetical protein
MESAMTEERGMWIFAGGVTLLILGIMGAGMLWGYHDTSTGVEGADRHQQPIAHSPQIGPWAQGSTDIPLPVHHKAIGSGIELVEENLPAVASYPISVHCAYCGSQHHGTIADGCRADGGQLQFPLLHVANPNFRAASQSLCGPLFFREVLFVCPRRLGGREISSGTKAFRVLKPLRTLRQLVRLD